MAAKKKTARSRPGRSRRVSEKTRRSAERAYAKGQAEHGGAIGMPSAPSPRRSKAVRKALKRMPRSSASRQALSRQAREAWKARREEGEITPEPRVRARAPKSKRARTGAKKRAGAEKRAGASAKKRTGTPAKTRTRAKTPSKKRRATRTKKRGAARAKPRG